MLRAATTQAVDARDYSSARVWLQRLYLAHPDETSTSRLIARFHATQRHPEELTRRARVIQTGPALLDDYLDWDSAAVRHGQIGVAREGLALVPSAWRQNAGYQELCAAVSIAAGQPQAADDQLATAARLEPSNPLHAINLAALRLIAADGETRRSARSALEGYAAASPPPVSAVRALFNDAVSQRDPARIARFRSALRQHGDHTLGDDLACISTDPTPEERRVELIALRQKVTGDPLQILQVAEWMIGTGGAAESLAWLRNLPADQQSNVGIQTGVADALTALRDWAGLHAFLEGKNWEGYDFMRVTLLVRCSREGATSTARWPEAVSACGNNPANLTVLAQTVGSWSWHAEAKSLRWRITELSAPPAPPPSPPSGAPTKLTRIPLSSSASPASNTATRPRTQASGIISLSFPSFPVPVIPRRSASPRITSAASPRTLTSPPPTPTRSIWMAVTTRVSACWAASTRVA